MSYHPSSLQCGLDAFLARTFFTEIDMNRCDTILNKNIPAHPEALRKKTAIHEAGHAAAIYLGNKQKQLPPIFFQIIIKEAMFESQSPGRLVGHCTNSFAKVEGGRLIHTLPSSIAEATLNFSLSEKQDYECAFEADILNLLAGPLSEAKYIAFCDGELFNPRLVNLDALHYYGGSSDVSLAYEYLDCFITGQKEKERKLSELFMAAYRFISHRCHWRAITALADFILCAGKHVIECEEIISVLDKSRLTAF